MCPASARRLGLALTSWVALGACASELGTAPAKEATLIVRAEVSATTAVTVVVQVSAPDLVPPLVFNIPVVNGVASGTITVATGSARTFTMHAYDAGGVETHRGAITRDVLPGNNTTISLVLAPLTGDVPIDVTLDRVIVTVSPSATSIAVGGTAPLTATITDSFGNPIAGTVTWATGHPGVASVDVNGLVTGSGAGSTQIVATFNGAAGSATVTVTAP
ncbi:MAG TPA: Ig-like domain-containing protein [Gemmatimonadales bacterium]|nr:Ig-like domain-containing protein [Gemmatimonadales bacterium]